MTNIDYKTVSSFGDEWHRFDQLLLDETEISKIFNEYFGVFPWEQLPPNAEGFDMGCGSGRWARLVAPRVAKLHCVDPSCAIDVAVKMLANIPNIVFHRASLDNVKITKGSQDFGYSLGVLHHVPDTAAAIRSCADLLKPGAPLLLYLYYAFDNRPLWFKALWQVSDILRRIICRLPPRLKHLVTDGIALFIYLPFSRLCNLMERHGFSVQGVPLSYYRNHTFYTMRTDSRDRFGTPLERRFRRDQIEFMMREAGLTNISFANGAPYWCALGFRSSSSGMSASPK